MKYVLVKAKNGKKMWYKDGGLVKKGDISDPVVRLLEEQGLTNKRSTIETTDDDQIKPDVTVAEKEEDTVVLEQTQEPKVCAVSGKPADTTKFINGQVIPLNKEAIEGLTTGEIVGLLREKDVV